MTNAFRKVSVFITPNEPYDYVVGERMHHITETDNDEKVSKIYDHEDRLVIAGQTKTTMVFKGFPFIGEME